MKTRVRECVVIFSIGILICSPILGGYSPINSSVLDGALELQIGSINWYKTDNTSTYVHFMFEIDLIVNNTSSENITITFADGNKWRTSIECKPVNESLVIEESGSYYIMILIDVTFEPGITHMTERTGIKVYDPNIENIPDGEYSIIIGEYYSKVYNEIADSVSKTFYIYNFYYTLTPPFETSTSWVGIIVGLLIIQILFARKIRKRRNEKVTFSCHK